MPKVVRLIVVAFLVSVVAQTSGWGQSPQPLSNAQRKKFERDVHAFREAVSLAKEDDPARGLLKPWDLRVATTADAAIFEKGLSWALRYDREFTPADIVLLDKAVQRLGEDVLGARGQPHH